MTVTRICLDTTDSTSNYLRHYRDALPDEMVVATAHYQTAGRGMGQNTWESQAGQNLLFSILTAPTWLPLERRFLLSEAQALAQKAALDAHTDGISLKWPNDVYWHDSKISGTLIETTLTGKSFGRCIWGTGVNVNQTHFCSDAPNPVSLRQITGSETDREKLLADMLRHFEHYYQLLREGRYDDIRQAYHASLYRRQGLHEFVDAKGSFMASIDRVRDNGRIILIDSQNNSREYELKEIRHGKI